MQRRYTVAEPAHQQAHLVLRGEPVMLSGSAIARGIRTYEYTTNPNSASNETHKNTFLTTNGDNSLKIPGDKEIEIGGTKYFVQSRQPIPYDWVIITLREVPNA